MTDIAIAAMSSQITIEPDAGAPPAVGGGADLPGMDVSRLKELLRPIIVDLLGEELARYRRMRG